MAADTREQASRMTNAQKTRFAAGQAAGHDGGTNTKTGRAPKTTVGGSSSVSVPNNARAQSYTAKKRTMTFDPVTGAPTSVEDKPSLKFDPVTGALTSVEATAASKASDKSAPVPKAAKSSPKPVPKATPQRAKSSPKPVPKASGYSPKMKAWAAEEQAKLRGEVSARKTATLQRPKSTSGSRTKSPFMH